MKERRWRADGASLEALMALLTKAMAQASERGDQREVRALKREYNKLARLAKSFPER